VGSPPRTAASAPPAVGVRAEGALISLRSIQQSRQRIVGRLFVPNFPQPQPYWLLSTEGRHPTRLDSRSRWWCCGTDAARVGDMRNKARSCHLGNGNCACLSARRRRSGTSRSDRVVVRQGSFTSHSPTLGQDGPLRGLVFILTVNLRPALTQMPGHEIGYRTTISRSSRAPWSAFGLKPELGQAG
jgi:hypothetical protein